MSGTTSVEELVKQGFSPDIIQKSLAEDRELDKCISPAGALNLPTFLDNRRLEYRIPDAAFSLQAAFTRILCWQLPPMELMTGMYGDSKIVVPGNWATKKKNECPRMLVLSAGLTALDTLKSHGMDLGHVITIIRECPFEMTTGMAAHRPVKVHMLSVGDICSSEDLAIRRREGSAPIFFNAKTSKHSYVADVTPDTVPTRTGY